MIWWVSWNGETNTILIYAQMNYGDYLDEAASSVSAVVHGVIGGASVPFPLPHPDGCTESGLTCPLPTGSTLSYKQAIYVSKLYPSVSWVWLLMNVEGCSCYMTLCFERDRWNSLWSGSWKTRRKMTSSASKFLPRLNRNFEKECFCFVMRTIFCLQVTHHLVFAHGFQVFVILSDFVYKYLIDLALRVLLSY